MCTEKGQILTNVAPEVINVSTELCIETGAILEAHKLNTSLTYSIPTDDMAKRKEEPSNKVKYRIKGELKIE